MQPSIPHNALAMMLADSIGPYRVLGKLGAGRMGEEYRARDPRLDRDIALKLLPRGQVKVLDFGLATRALSAGPPASQRTRKRRRRVLLQQLHKVSTQHTDKIQPIGCDINPSVA